MNLLDNDQPIDFRATEYEALFRNLQGNIVKGHGRDFTVSLFLEFQVRDHELRETLRSLTRKYVRSAFDQLVEREQYSRFSVPGALFGSLLLAAGTYKKLGHDEAQLKELFQDDTDNAGNPKSLFADGMFASRGEFHDRLIEPEEKRQALEHAYERGTIDAMLLLADDSQSYLLRRARKLMTSLEGDNRARIVAVELGEALRNRDGEGVEHFGYVDGRSQPLFLASDFRTLDNGEIRERIGDESTTRQSGKVDIWDPFAPLKLALVADPGSTRTDAFGSYYVFRKLEQDVLRFAMAEQQLADRLGLEGADRKRAGAMIVGRFRDGTPLTLSSTDGFLPSKMNNFRYDELNAEFAERPGAVTDAYGLKCPFQAHIRKVNPRQNVNLEYTNTPIPELARLDRDRRIVRRGITYGGRTRTPDAFKALEDLPTCDVGLLFACFQGDLRKQFAFMQRQWANRITFMVRGTNDKQTGLDTLIGQRQAGQTILPQRWRREYGDDGDETGAFKYTSYVRDMPANESHPTEFTINGFVRFRGGEFFFAPSISFLLNE